MGVAGGGGGGGGVHIYLELRDIIAVTLLHLKYSVWLIVPLDKHSVIVPDSAIFRTSELSL